MKGSYFRFYGQLNDFLPAEKKHKTNLYRYWGNPTIQDACAAQGVPHPEIFLVIISGKPGSIKENLQGGERVAVYSRWFSVKIPSEWIQQPKLPDYPRFEAAPHLGKLVRLMRILGLDVVFKGDEPAGRILLTRKVTDLKMNRVSLGYLPRSDNPYLQLDEVLDYFDLKRKVNPFSRCPECNSFLVEVKPQQIWDRLEPRTKKYYRKFKQCPDCNKIYWRGSHFRRLQEKLKYLVPGEEGTD